VTHETPQEKHQRQLELESESLSLGAARYNGERMAWHDAEPGSTEAAEQAPEKSLLKRTVEPLAERIIEALESLANGKAGRRHVALKYLAIDDAEPLQLAFIALRRIINHASIGMSYADTAYGIGTDIKEHLEYLRFARDKNTKGLAIKVSAQLARSTSAQHRLGVVRHVLEKYAAKHKDLSWSKNDRIQIGAKLIDLAVVDSKLFEVRHDKVARNKTRVTVGFTAYSETFLKEAHHQCELLSPVHLPMIVKPMPWSTPYKGGYMTRALRPNLVRAPSRAYLDELGGVDLSRVTAAVNAVQETGWRINRKVLDVILAEIETGGASAGLPPTGAKSLPPRPAGIPEDVPFSKLTASQKEDIQGWRVQAAQVHIENASNRRERVVVAQKLYVAKKFRDEEALYFPHFIDFRGRVYPTAAYLTPQGDDLCRGLLEFADGKPLGKDGGFWLASHIAGLFDIDKVPFEERAAWTWAHDEEIMAAALSPEDDNAFWRQSKDNPVQALAACYEWLGFRMNGEAHISHISVAMDGSCSGLQHYSALLRDEVGGAAVNLVPSPRPADVYTAVANRAQVLSDASGSEFSSAWKGKVCRKIAKQPTMTLCYSATKFGMWKQIQSALAGLDKHEDYLGPNVDRYQASKEMANIVWQALGETVVAARTAMDWLQEVSSLMAEAGLPLRWTTPLGLPIMQAYMHMERTTIHVRIAGREMQLDLRSKGEKLNGRKQASSIAPNFVHSLDAAHLMSTALLGKEYGLESFAMIHDSFGVHAADVTLLNAVLREAFVEQYTPDLLARFRDEVVEQLTAAAPEMVERVPPLPKKGSLDLDAVKNSEFFFA
jgi:DNA-directed RNA polymerase